jgi:hypothetical protein
MPFWPVNHSRPAPSKAGVLRLASAASAGSGKLVTFSVAGSTRTMALRPPSVIQAAPSGPAMTPWGAESAPSASWRVAPVAGSRMPSAP